MRLFPLPLLQPEHHLRIVLGIVLLLFSGCTLFAPTLVLDNPAYASLLWLPGPAWTLLCAAAGLGCVAAPAGVWRGASASLAGLVLLSMAASFMTAVSGGAGTAVLTGACTYGTLGLGAFLIVWSPR